MSNNTKTTHTKNYYSQENSTDQLERYKLLVENIEDYAIFLLDTEGHIVSWNLGAEKFKGYKPNEIIGKHFSVFYSEEDKKSGKPARELEESKANGRVEDEGWRIRKDGSRFWANVIITALFDRQGIHRGFAKVTRDLTERKLHEDTLFDANVKLEASYKEMQRLNELKDEFVSLASHQLRTPATGVKQYLGILLEGYMGELTEPQLDCLQKAYESNEREIEIINDLLQVAQLDAGKVSLNKAPTLLCDVIENIIDEQVEMFKVRQQQVVLKIPDHTLVGSVDPIRFRMVLENLIDNASKYTMSKGKIIISLTRAGKFYKISIQDNGVGIKKSDIKKLFEKFSRLSNPLTKNVSGSGLGLYWAGKIIQLHGGHIDLDSVPKKGTTFSVFLPAEKTNG
ncbi:MAG: hypothetical protein JWO47_615 [Candidatus Saccharibacteria bacterium]|nr:hypothetical protein [Candidatus Saccharibacteria bacterium]